MFSKMNELQLVGCAALFVLSDWGCSGHKINCPKLECMGNDPNKYHPATNVCYEHDNQVPTTKLIGQDCQYHQDRTLEFTDKVICDFDLLTNNFAWVEEHN